MRHIAFLDNGKHLEMAINTTMVTVEVDSTVIARLPAAAGVGVDSITSWPIQARHWIVWLSSGTSVGAASAAAQRLRLTPHVPFASNAYDIPPEGPGTSACTVKPVNTLLGAS